MYAAGSQEPHSSCQGLLRFCPSTSGTILQGKSLEEPLLPLLPCWRAQVCYSLLPSIAVCGQDFGLFLPLLPELGCIDAFVLSLSLSSSSSSQAFVQSLLVSSTLSKSFPHLSDAPLWSLHTLCTCATLLLCLRLLAAAVSSHVHALSQLCCGGSKWLAHSCLVHVMHPIGCLCCLR